MAPAGGWAQGDDSYKDVLAWFTQQQSLLHQAAPYADQIDASDEGRRRATEFVTTNYEHIPAELVAHMISAGAGCAGADTMIENALHEGWPLDPAQITCPVRVI